jgi:hypothetical protein
MKDILTNGRMECYRGLVVGFKPHMDYLERDVTIDSKKVALIGHSRLAKWHYGPGLRISGLVVLE